MKSRIVLLLVVFLCLSGSEWAFPQAAVPRVLTAVDDRGLVTLGGNTHPLARAQFDQGPMLQSAPLRRMLLVLRRSPEQEAALKQLINEQQDRTSSHYHHWLSPMSLGASFGPSDHDLALVTEWLASAGFTGIRVNPSHTLLEFSGTAGSVESALHTSMHRYLVSGVQHFGNASDPQIPLALAPVVAGIASLNNFVEPMPVSASTNANGETRGVTSPRAPLALSTSTASWALSNSSSPEYTTSTTGGATAYAVTPYDFAAIYNVTPLWNSSIDGTGQTIAVVGGSDINAADFVNFRKLFGLPIGDASSATQTQYLNLIYNGINPGINADERKGAADTQWSGAVAKGATIDYVASETTEVSAGSDLSAAYIVDNNLAPVMVDSFSRCERDAGAAYNAFINNLWQQAAAQGITVVVGAGDSGSAGCDATSSTAASGGLAVNALASTPYNVAVGGTDFYMPNGGAPYWNGSNDPATASSAKGYIPETTWNDSCTNANFSAMSPYSGQTPEQICNSSAASAGGLLTVRGGGGGASNCGLTSGPGCSGYSKPSWQTSPGVPADGVRDLPDLSLFAGDGVFGSQYFLCQQSALPAGNACSLGKPSVNFVGAGGTSFSSAAFAGIMALVNQKTGSRQGNANYTLYNLAQQQSKAGAACTSTGPPSASCVFNDITTGTNAMPCVTGSLNCTTTNSGDTYGVLSGYSSTTGYDLTTGLGSVNAANLVNGWLNAVYTSTRTTLALSATSIVHGSPVTATVNVSSPSGVPTGQVSIDAAAANGSVGSGTLNNGVFSGTYTTFPGGSYPVTAYYGGDGGFAASESAPVTLTVTPEASTTTEGVFDQIGQTAANVPYGDILTLRVDVAGVSGSGYATGNVSVKDNGAVLYGGVYRLNSSGYTEVRTNSLPVGTHSLVSTYVGDPSFNPSTSAAYELTIVKANTTASVSPSVTNVTDASTITFTVIIGTAGYGFLSPSGIVTLTDGGQTVGQASLLTLSNSGGTFDSSIATISVPANLLPNGTSQVTVSYPGDSNYLPSSATSAPITVTSSGLPSTTTTLSLNPVVVAPNGTLTFTANITSSAGGLNGTVQFAIDGVNVGVAAPVSSGTATEQISVAAFATGVHTATAIYSGDNAHKSSRSPAQTFTIAQPTGLIGSNTTISVSPTAATQGTVVVVQVAVTPGTPQPTGTVQILIDGNFFGSPLTLSPSGTASFSVVTATLQAGLHSVTVYYSGDGTYMPSFSSPGSFTIYAPGNFPDSIALSGVPPVVGSGVTFSFTAAISPASPAPTGTLEIIVDNGTPMPQLPLQSNPQTLSLNTTGLALGGHTVSVYYSGDQRYSPATSPAVSFTVVPADARFTLTPTTASVHIPIGPSISNPLTFTINAAAGDSFPVSFACTSGLPAGIVCSFSPVTVNVNGTGSTKLTFVINHLSQNAKPPMPGQWRKAAGAFSLAGLILLILPRRKRAAGWIFALIAMLTLGVVSGCGVTVRPALGPYPIVVTATSGASVLGITTRTATVELTIGGRL